MCDAGATIEIEFEDMHGLDPEQYLNDNIINAYMSFLYLVRISLLLIHCSLTLLMQDGLSDEKRARVHICSTYFYKKLTTLLEESGVCASLC